MKIFLFQHLQSDHKIHLHCFVGTIDDVYLFTSYFTEIKFGFTPIITRYNFLHSVIQQLDLTQILSETDSPYFTPEEVY
jgi:TatD DNase family protein